MIKRKGAGGGTGKNKRDKRKGLDMEGYQAYFEQTPFKVGLHPAWPGDLRTRLARSRAVHGLRVGGFSIRQFLRRK
jgi:hypothetical protein